MGHHVIFIPGLGDHRPYGQDKAIQLWRLGGLVPHYFPLGWHNPEGFAAKQARLQELVRSLHEQGHTVSLVGVSAGASAVLNTYAADAHILAVVLICGKVNRPEIISDHAYARNPDFKESVYGLRHTLPLLPPAKRSRILSIHPWADAVVPVPDTRVDGAKELTLPGWGHKSGIFFGIILGTPAIARFIRSHA